MTQPDIWYVAFGPDKTVKTDDSAGTSRVRSTRTFKTEVDAKLFAMQILAKGWTASAGTLNPHQPKQVVGPATWSAGPIRGLTAKGGLARFRPKCTSRCGPARSCTSGGSRSMQRGCANPQRGANAQLAGA